MRIGALEWTFKLLEVRIAKRLQLERTFSFDRTLTVILTNGNYHYTDTKVAFFVVEVVSVLTLCVTLSAASPGNTETTHELIARWAFQMLL